MLIVFWMNLNQFSVHYKFMRPRRNKRRTRPKERTMAYMIEENITEINQSLKELLNI